MTLQSPTPCERGASEPAFPRAVLESPKLRLPGRDHLVFRGSLASVLGLGRHNAYGLFERRSPDLLWPDDRGWYIATDVDLEFGYVGGSKALIAHLLEDPRLAAVALHADDALVEEDNAG